MQSIPKNTTLTYLAYISLLPLLFSLCLAVYHAINITEITGYTLAFSRLNAYIFAHSYGALLLMLFAGIQLGQNLSQPNRWNTLFNFMLLILAWISYQSFADVLGMSLLLCLWIAALISDFRVNPQNNIPKWYTSLKFELNTTVIIMLLSIILLNK